MLDRAPDAVLNDSTAAPARGRALLVDLYDAAVAGAAPGPITTDALRDFDARPDQRLSLLGAHRRERYGHPLHPREWLYRRGHILRDPVAQGTALDRQQHVDADVRAFDLDALEHADLLDRLADLRIANLT